MRPDEHKKKKNAQYKKKHGIKTGKAAGEESRLADKKKNQLHRKDDKGGELRRRGAQVGSEAGAGQGQAQAKTNSDSSDSDTCTDHNGPVYQRKSFSRRQIVSNWAKYELPEAGDGSAEPRGEDFSKLLASAGDALAQFRFKDEKDWEESSSQSAETSHVISLDCQCLADAVDCVPLYRRLGLEKDNFTESQVILQDLEAQKKQELYKSGQVQSSTGVEGEVKNVTPTPEPHGHTKRKHQAEISLSNLAKPSTVTLDFGRTPNIKDKPQCATDMKPSVKVETKTVGSTTESELDEDLDFLLSLDAPSQSDHKKQVQAKADKTDAVANVKIVDVESDITSSSEVKKGSAGKEEDLEDWLDSVLGD